ncbi:MAG: hypothetical protein WC683_07840 [bacterium]
MTATAETPPQDRPLSRQAAPDDLARPRFPQVSAAIAGIYSSYLSAERGGAEVQVH